MAQREAGQQPQRPCMYPPPVYHEPDHEAESSQAAELREQKKQKRIQYSGMRETSPNPTAPTAPVDEAALVQIPAAPAGMNKILWRKLHPELVEKVLSHLPVHILWQTVMAINPARWKQILADGNLLGHVNHVDSTIGLIKVYSTLGWAIAQPGIGIRPPALHALEHTTGTWQPLPRFPTPNVRRQMWVQSVSEGLILLMMGPEDGYFKMAVWNPIQRSHRWLPVNPSLPVSNTEFILCTEVLVVHREKGYKVIEFVESVLALPRMTNMFHRHHSHGTHMTISGYAVYDSSSYTWGAIHRSLMNTNSGIRTMNTCVISCEGCVCLANMEWGMEFLWAPRLKGIVSFDPFLNSWSQALIAPEFFDNFPGNCAGYSVQKLLYAGGRIYMIFAGVSKELSISYYGVSISLADIQSGIAAFEHMGILVEQSPRHGNQPNHPAPTTNLSQNSPQEQFLRCRCGCRCAYEWYMLPDGRNYYLCLMVCNRWVMMYDLYARVWTKMMIDVPTDPEPDQATSIVRAVNINTPLSRVPSGRPAYHPYVPSWTNV